MLVLLRAAGKKWKSKTPDNRFFAVLLAFTIIFGWYIVFWNHTIIHPFFMARLLVIFPLTAVFCLVNEYGKTGWKGPWIKERQKLTKS
jgi:hypothetical protein